jgi:hypothetical protein
MPTRRFMHFVVNMGLAIGYGISVQAISSPGHIVQPDKNVDKSFVT